MQVKEVYITLDEAVNIFEIITDTLKQNCNSQIFVEESFISKLIKNERIDGICKPCLGHYNSTANEYALILKESKERYAKAISIAYFAINCVGYCQLIEFNNSKEDIFYQYYHQGMEQVLFIEEKK